MMIDLYINMMRYGYIVVRIVIIERMCREVIGLDRLIKPWY